MINCLAYSVFHAVIIRKSYIAKCMGHISACEIEAEEWAHPSWEMANNRNGSNTFITTH